MEFDGHPKQTPCDKNQCRLKCEGAENVQHVLQDERQHHSMPPKGSISLVYDRMPSNLANSGGLMQRASYIVS